MTVRNRTPTHYNKDKQARIELIQELAKEVIRLNHNHDIRIVKEHNNGYYSVSQDDNP